MIRERARAKAVETAEILRKDPEQWEMIQGVEVREMVEAYYVNYLADTYSAFLDSVKDEGTHALFARLFTLYLKTKVIEDGAYFRDFLEQEHFDQLKEDVTTLLGDLRPDAVAMTDILPLANRMLGPFGNEDMQVYNRFFNSVLLAKGVRERAPWWRLAYTNEDK